ncbi:MAG: putative membrane protein [uncultured bacterium]|nr:MAG: putative membrane protein [uncultured bacterium]
MENKQSINNKLAKIWQNEGLKQFIKFGIVGLSGTIIDLGFYNLLAISLGFNIYIARTISFVLAATSNYFLNRTWTFQSKEKKIAKEYSQFFFVSVVGLLLNLVIMRVVLNYTKDFASEILEKNIPVLIAIIIVLFWNFIANKYWTFKH